ncbi:KdsC family phosphatase [Zunongwangia profunda]|uniref:3-deoxy-D-manno-octulosonate 8-phosphate phosphatase n=2 Tax=Zunongwangia profunda TaxID=398743 RepID=D5BCW9_ZUNPS|nr:HAD-IIIA family hydrolase [Zunongwangia profunda]MAC64653.1 3-deoxy-D-manno-octulosonate 8-phosphate phosphatase [Flavobacteriaceae bacterium]MAS71428.1 3-deoxy-D-manno-octulosonate 8-phosphate phosphatase [Zunongwangia sp.]ADF52649.1 3-deoxy-D-manno-octulosonate 8-phosphate phosphatase [Zunongwangia profunda SM-A87]HAJ82107.1 3-deoxy-D-manno-octulosonate 8-phosphate phosphatase [Zunongwangia profunda]HCV81436.1 3-deoxy-D-manno-octulosonate 8-phosphate phosphatase [Zunongwangia profunda]|tara:strand:- start:15038 stop:15547 length:510 start_codon:yes stop_codon:yes gene_type:complete
MEKSYKEYLNNISTFIFDVDGVLTNGSVQVTADGDLLRSMSVKDGYALKQAVKAGYTVCIISGGKNEGVRTRLRDLGITDIYLGIDDKVEQLDEFFDIYDIKAENVLYMGDDIPDMYPMQLIGLPTCPQDAVPEVKGVSKYISHKNGGEGCVRDVIEQVMKVQAKWIEK